MKNKIQEIFLTFFYIGYSPYFPGTVASFFASIVWFFLPNSKMKFLLLLLVILFAFVACYFYDKHNERKDPSFIVIDEVVGMWIGLFYLPNDFILYSIAFFLFRFFDILKPSFIHHSQNIPNGIGIILDDLLSGIFTFLIMYCILLI